MHMYINDLKVFNNMIKNARLRCACHKLARFRCASELCSVSVNAWVKKCRQTIRSEIQAASFLNFIFELHSSQEFECSFRNYHLAPIFPRGQRCIPDISRRMGPAGASPSPRGYQRQQVGRVYMVGMWELFLQTY